MNLTKTLRNQGYDLIEGPIRNHKPLQLWFKKPFNEVDFRYEHIKHAFVSEVALNEIENSALKVTSSTKDDYSFNIGITVLEDVLKSLGLGALEISSKIKSGKTVTISYDNSLTREYEPGIISNYLSTSDFQHNNPELLKNANRNNILAITGAIFAKNLITEIKTDLEISAELVAELNQIGSGKLDFTVTNQTTLKMVSEGNVFFPIAVRAHRIDFDKGRFSKLILVTDHTTFNGIDF